MRPVSILISGFGEISKLNVNLPNFACGPINTGQGRIPIPIFLSKFPLPMNNFPVTIDGAAKPICHSDTNPRFE